MECICINLNLSVHNNSKTKIKGIKKGTIRYKLSLQVWYLPDLNWGHTDFQSVALPTELRYPVLKATQK